MTDKRYTRVTHVDFVRHPPALIIDPLLYLNFMNERFPSDDVLVLDRLLDDSCCLKAAALNLLKLFSSVLGWVVPFTHTTHAVTHKYGRSVGLLKL